MIEERLRVVESGGYLYAQREGVKEDVLYRTYGPKMCMIYQARRVAQQTNAGGGAIVIDIAAETPFEILGVRALNSGNNSIIVATYDEDNAFGVQWANVGAAAGTSAYLPSVGSTAGAAANIAQSTKCTVPPGSVLAAAQGGAGVQNDTLTLYVVLKFPITAQLGDITWSVARSTNFTDVTLAASTISDANTWQAVLLP